MKSCKRCLIVKPLDQFHKHPQTSDNRFNTCIECYRIEGMDRYRKNKDKYLARQRQRYHSDIDHRLKKNKYSSLYYFNNIDRMKELIQKHYQENKEELYLRHREYFQNNPEKMKMYIKRWRAKHSEFDSFQASLRRIYLKKAIPKWADRIKIREIYKEARNLELVDGIKRHVDHIVPLKGDNVCGLHVENNLEILFAEDNKYKSNFYEDEFGLDLNTILQLLN